MIHRLGLAALAAGFALSALAGTSAGVASAAPVAPECGDVHFIGAAGSGQRDGANLTANGGMGGVVYQTYLQLRTNLMATGHTVTAEAVAYPAAPVPLEGGVGGWMGFMDSVKAGTTATETQYEAFTKQCPDTMVVLAGYSQGAMIVHRNLEDLADDPHLAAALLVADGDRLPGDTTIDMGSTAALLSPETKVGKGVAQEHSFLASAPTSKLPAALGARTISVCDVGDPVCDYDADSDGDAMSPAAIAIHTSYVPTASGGHAWGAPLYGLVMNSLSAVSPGTDTGTTPDTQLTAHRVG